MAENTLLLPFLSGLVLLAIAVGVLRLRRWRRRGATPRGRAGSPSTTVSAGLNSPTTWSLVFFLLVLGAVAGALAVVGALPVPEGAQPLVTAALLAGTGLALAGFVFGGVYASVRNRGYGSAPAVGLGSLTVGLLVALVVVVNLVLG